MEYSNEFEQLVVEDWSVILTEGYYLETRNEIMIFDYIDGLYEEYTFICRGQWKLSFEEIKTILEKYNIKKLRR
jgi:hypothetical protein